MKYYRAKGIPRLWLTLWVRGWYRKDELSIWNKEETKFCVRKELLELLL